MQSENTQLDDLKKTKVEMSLNGFEIKILLEALGRQQNFQLDNRLSTKASTNLINKVYRALGIQL